MRVRTSGKQLISANSAKRAMAVVLMILCEGRVDAGSGGNRALSLRWRGCLGFYIVGRSSSTLPTLDLLPLDRSTAVAQLDFFAARVRSATAAHPTERAASLRERAMAITLPAAILDDATPRLTKRATHEPITSFLCCPLHGLIV